MGCNLHTEEEWQAICTPRIIVFSQQLVTVNAAKTTTTTNQNVEKFNLKEK